MNDLAYFMFLRVLDLETPSLFSFLFFFFALFYSKNLRNRPLLWPESQFINPIPRVDDY